MKIFWEESVDVNKEEILLFLEVYEEGPVRFMDDEISEPTDIRKYQREEFTTLLEKGLVAESKDERYGDTYINTTKKGNYFYTSLEKMREGNKEIQEIFTSVSNEE